MNVGYDAKMARLYIYRYSVQHWLKFKQYFLFGVPLQTSSFLHYGLAYTVFPF